MSGGSRLQGRGEELGLGQKVDPDLVQLIQAGDQPNFAHVSGFSCQSLGESADVAGNGKPYGSASHHSELVTSHPYNEPLNGKPLKKTVSARYGEPEAVASACTAICFAKSRHVFSESIVRGQGEDHCEHHELDHEFALEAPPVGLILLAPLPEPPVASLILLVPQLAPPIVDGATNGATGSAGATQVSWRHFVPPYTQRAVKPRSVSECGRQNAGPKSCSHSGFFLYRQ